MKLKIFDLEQKEMKEIEVSSFQTFKFFMVNYIMFVICTFLVGVFLGVLGIL